MTIRPTRFAALLLALGLAAALALTLATGCGTGNPYPPGSFERAQFFADHDKNFEAVASYEAFVRRNPTDSLAAVAQFRKAMTYMEMKEYPLAAVEFQILRKDYPTSDLVPEAMYREGEAYLGEIGRVQRDISGAYSARTQFLNFIDRYPDSPLRADAEKSLVEISDIIVRKRLKEIDVYRHLHRDKAVAATLDNLLSEEKQSSLLDRVLWERAQIASRLGEEEEAQRYLEQLRTEYPDSPYAGRVKSTLPTSTAMYVLSSQLNSDTDLASANIFFKSPCCYYPASFAGG